MKRGRQSALALKEQNNEISEFQKYFLNRNDLPSPCDPVQKY